MVMSSLRSERASMMEADYSVTAKSKAVKASRRAICKFGFAALIAAAGKRAAQAYTKMAGTSTQDIASTHINVKPHVAVIGAGAFGGWTAFYLLQGGARVTLLDAWGPGNSRASSGGETRVMRGTYGPDQPYTEMAARALKLWGKYERKWKRQFLHRCGVLWMASGHDDAFERGSVKMLRAAKIPFKELSAPQMRKRWPQINFDGIEWGIFEPECGYLDARASCAAVVDAFIKAGGRYTQASVQFEGLEDPRPRGIRLSDDSQLKADGYVFACGPWLGKLFPKAVGNLIQATKQNVFFFGTPAGDTRF